MNSKAMILGVVTTVLSAQALALQSTPGSSSHDSQGLGIEEVKPQDVVAYIAYCPFPFVPPQCN